MSPDALAWLAALATAAIGEPVTVRELAPDAGPLGMAGREAGGAVVKMRGDLDASRALFVLYHEAAHLALQHVPATGTTNPRPAAGSIVARMVAPTETKQEAEADAWAREQLADLAPEMRALTAWLIDGDAGPLRALAGE